MTKKVLLVFALCVMVAMGSSSTSFLRKQTALIPDVDENTASSTVDDADTLKLISIPKSDQSSGATFLGNTPIISIDDLIARQNATNTTNATSAMNGTDEIDSSAEETTEQRGLDTENNATNATNGTNSTVELLETPEDSENSEDDFLGNTPIVSIDDLTAQQNGTNGTNATNATAEETTEQRKLDSENTETSAANSTDDTLKLISIPENGEDSSSTFLGNTPIISIDDLIAQQNTSNDTNNMAEEVSEQTQPRGLDTNITSEANITEAEPAGTPMVGAVSPIVDAKNEESNEASEEESYEDAEESSESTQQLLNTTATNNTSTTFLGNTPIISIDDLINQNSA